MKGCSTEEKKKQPFPQRRRSCSYSLVAGPLLTILRRRGRNGAG